MYHTHRNLREEQIEDRQRQPDRHIDILTETEAGVRQRYRARGRWSDKQSDRQTEAQNNEERQRPVLCVGVAGMHYRA